MYDTFDYDVFACTVGAYNDKFLMASKGMLSVQQFAEWEKKRTKRKPVEYCIPPLHFAAAVFCAKIRIMRPFPHANFSLSLCSV